MASYAVVIGLLRDIPELYTVLDQLVLMKQEGLLDGLVLSTWHGEVDRHEGLAAKLSRAGIDVVESVTPTARIQPKAMWNAWIQATALRRGLDLVPGGATVLKARSDKSAHLVRHFRGIVEAGPKTHGRPDWMPEIFSARVAMSLARVAVPLHASDFVFYGLKQDVAQIARRDGDLEADAMEYSVGVENRWFAAPVVRHLPRLASFYRDTNPFPLSTCLYRWAEGEPGPPPPDSYWDALALGFCALSAFAQVLDQDVTPARLTIEDVIRPSSTLGARTQASNRGPTRRLANNEVIRRLAHGEVDDSPAADAFRAAVARLPQTAFAPLGETDVAELSAFAAAYGGGPDIVRQTIRVRRAEPGPQREAFKVENAYELYLDALRTPDAERTAIRALIQARKDKKQGRIYETIGDAYLAGDGLPQSDDAALAWYDQGSALRDAACQLRWAKVLLAPGKPRLEPARHAAVIRRLTDAAHKLPEAKALLAAQAKQAAPQG